jgi:pSer/pThr/pTyr-binding forkhead associated (FHA) protein
MSAYVLRDGPATYPLKMGLNTVGRLPDNDVVIADPYISRRHCAIVIHANNQCEIQDIASKNGTIVNGQPIQRPSRLQPGDSITLCDRKIIFATVTDAVGVHEPPDSHTLPIE